MHRPGHMVDKETSNCERAISPAIRPKSAMENTSSSDGGGSSDGNDSDKENMPPSQCVKVLDPSHEVGNRVVRLNEGPLPSRVFVPREFVTTVHSQFADMRDKIEGVITKHKKERDATRKRHERARNKLASQVNDLKRVVSERDDALKLMELALTNHKASIDNLRTQLAAAKTDLANAKIASKG
eukprot:jgi/Mesvir1/20079/Mv13328-RA.1